MKSISDIVDALKQHKFEIPLGIELDIIEMKKSIDVYHGQQIFAVTHFVGNKESDPLSFAISMIDQRLAELKQRRSASQVRLAFLPYAIVHGENHISLRAAIISV